MTDWPHDKQCSVQKGGIRLHYANLFYKVAAHLCLIKGHISDHAAGADSTHAPHCKKWQMMEILPVLALSGAYNPEQWQHDLTCTSIQIHPIGALNGIPSFTLQQPALMRFGCELP